MAIHRPSSSYDAMLRNDSGRHNAELHIMLCRNKQVFFSVVDFFDVLLMGLRFDWGSKEWCIYMIYYINACFVLVRSWES